MFDKIFFTIACILDTPYGVISFIIIVLIAFFVTFFDFGGSDYD